MPEQTLDAAVGHLRDFDDAVEKIANLLYMQGSTVSRTIRGDALDTDPYFSHNTYNPLGHFNGDEWVELDPPMWWDPEARSMKEVPEGGGRGYERLRSAFPAHVRSPDSPTRLVAACLGSPYSSYIFKRADDDLVESTISRYGIVTTNLWGHFGGDFGWLRYGTRPAGGLDELPGLDEAGEASRLAIQDLFTALCSRDPAVQEDFQDAVLSSLIDSGRTLTMKNVLKEALRRCPDAPVDPPDRFDLDVFLEIPGPMPDITYVSDDDDGRTRVLTRSFIQSVAAGDLNITFTSLPDDDGPMPEEGW